MTHSPIWRAPVRVGGRSLVLLVLALGVAACSDTGEFTFGSRDAAAAGPAPIGATRQVERDVEAPEVFDVTDEGLWDGRPSLGGVWVAHPDATDPERVIIRNTETGRFVIGALFRRERENPGPPLQISSDAAAALDILAGAPATVQVIALRREEAPDAEAPDADAPVADAGLADAGAPAAESDSPAPSTLPAIATAALAPASAAPGVDTASRPVPRPLAAQSVPAAPAIAHNMSAEDIMAGIQRAAFSPEALAPASPAPARPVPAIAAVADAAISENEIATAMLAPIEATPLDTPSPARAAAEAPLPDQAYVQIGIFSVQENANATGQTLRNAGLVPTIYDQTSSGRQFWRVVVGPAPTAEDRAAILDTVRGLGFGDAYFVAR
ncbi:MAG: hypothetical protein HLUCCO18_16330 [Rhodobacteraceae bacterium HLUCCO18]|nr:MAG: hypothetical protein HLUCCO18_16330 [Rhodobacteraceae bacterium HLUCCO18]